MEPSEFYAAQQRTGEATAILARRQWRKMRTLDDWPQIVSRLTLMVTAGQVGAASRAEDYVSSMVDVGPVAAVNPRAFGGVASDGRPLDSLLFSSVVHARSLYGSGAKDAEIMAAGQKWLDLLVRTQVADAGRGASQVAIAARPRVGYVRHVSPPCCQRCAVLAGKFFRWNAGFQRHPKCDCVHIPTTEGDADGFKADIGPDDIKDLTKAQRRAIGDGADMNQVINAHRKGARSADGMFTSEGTTRRGVAGRRLAGQRRLTPEAIYRTAKSQDEALLMLRQYGYIF